MAKYATQLYSELEVETSVATGWVKTGALGVCQTEDRRREWLRASARARAYGIDMYEISLKEAEDLCPMMSTEGLVSAFYLPEDGQTDPVNTTQALAKGARMQGVTILEDVAANGVLKNRGRVSGVRTEHGDIEAEYLVNCAGMWARQFGALAGVNIPLQAAEHYYLVTEPIEGLPPGMPVLEDPSRHTYIREEVGGLMVGLFEPVCAPWMVEGIPQDFSFVFVEYRRRFTAAARG